jgi:hypothetical protein
MFGLSKLHLVKSFFVGTSSLHVNLYSTSRKAVYQQSRSSLSGQLAVASTYLPGVDKQNLVESGPQSRGSRAVPGFTASRISAGSCLLQQIGLALRWQRFLVSVTSHFMVKRVTWNVLATEQRRLGTRKRCHNVSRKPKA